MKIRDKLLGLTGISVSALLLVLGMSWVANEQVTGINHAATDVKQLEVTLLNLRRNEKDFLLRRDTKYLDKFQTNYALFQIQLNVSLLSFPFSIWKGFQLEFDILLNFKIIFHFFATSSFFHA